MGESRRPEARVRASVDRLRAAWAEIASLLETRIRDRCPHRAADDRCTYPAGCRNQRLDGARVRCGGDALLLWEGP